MLRFLFVCALYKKLNFKNEFPEFNRKFRQIGHRKNGWGRFEPKSDQIGRVYPASHPKKWPEFQTAHQKSDFGAPRIKISDRYPRSARKANRNDNLGKRYKAIFSPDI